ncbi:hypothetical protein [Rana grylio virus]|uniref:Uncharacterized protein n=2 Tax=Frog virus 3 TaxID=10493 RepID=H9XFN7_FRG3V|nr:hypothetical protein [Rana grylio virus]AVM86138.1 hypothetical protein [Rana nigromaculata ranavirus]
MWIHFPVRNYIHLSHTILHYPCPGNAGHVCGHRNVSRNGLKDGLGVGVVSGGVDRTVYDRDTYPHPIKESDEDLGGGGVGSRERVGPVGGDHCHG